MGESVGLIYKKISSVMSDIGSVGKDRENKEQHWKFRGIEDLYNAAHPAMLKHGVFCVPQVLDHQAVERPRLNPQGVQTGTATWILMRVSHKFFCEDGSFVDVITTGEGLDYADKAANKCLSAAFKYALVELFCVPTQDIEDSDRTTPGEEPDRALPPPKTLVRPDAAPTDAPKRTRKPKAEVPLPPATPLPDAYIALEKQDWLRMKFVEKLPVQYRGNIVAESLRKGWLKSEGFLDDKGEGTSTKILESQFRDVATRLLEWAESQKIVPAPTSANDDIPF